VGGPLACGLGGGLKTLTRKAQYLLKITTHSLGNRTDYLAQPKHRKMDVRFGTWNVRSLYRSGSLKMVARELGK
jgi:hypothetical protein